MNPQIHIRTTHQRRWRVIGGFLAVATAVALVIAPQLPAGAVAAEPANDLDGTCAILRTGSGASTHVTRGSVGYGTRGSAASAVPIRFEATDLGRYRLIDARGGQLYMSVLGTVMPGSSYGTRADWTITKTGANYSISSTLTGQGTRSLLGGWVAGSGSVTLTPATGCANAADVATGVSGTPEPAVNADGTLNGFIDAHAHITAAKAFGGGLRCGTPFAEGGVEVALAGCLSHSALGLGGYGGALIAGTDPFMNPKGWPTFEDWPTPTTLLHEQAYFRGIQRAWESGERVHNALLVANRVICEIYPDRVTSCNEMDQLRLQAQYLRDMQDYVDAQSGGPGMGWFRIAATPEDVRAIAAQGKLAVIVGAENSELFGCREINDVAQCTTADIDAGLDELQSFGVSGLYPVHKFDNAFGGTRFDSGAQGAAVNIGNRISTGHFWQAESCEGATDNEQPLRSDEIAALLKTVTGLPHGTVAPVYPQGGVCNIRGLTELGGYLIDQMMDRGMVINIDHMGIKTADAVLDQTEAAGYSGVATTHSWSDTSIIARIADAGGFVASYANSAEPQAGRGGFLNDWRDNSAAMSPGSVTGYGFGTDVNGLGNQAAARSNSAELPLVYPFTALNGATVDREMVGQRTYDLNTDGMANYGLLADWTADVVLAAGADGPALKELLMNSAEAYTRMWEAARVW
ncbi:hypothetical protein [Microbacterium sp. Root61]|uniref:hypothetical protein n=1 Tax=Microbacterium sp. Root61 TaxID=1736570 RepID=UPI000A516585|nr:hypothetical protein [Microbacterium sp. Root61]